MALDIKDGDVIPDKKKVIEEFLQSKEFIDIINGEKGKAVENWQKEKLPVVLETEFEKRMKLQEEKSKKTPEQIQLEEALKRIERMELETAAERREKLRLENKAHAISELSNKNFKVPESLLDKFISDEPEKTKQNLKLFEDFINDYTTSLKADKVKSNNVFVPGNKDISGDDPEPGEDATDEEFAAWYKRQRTKK